MFKNCKIILVRPQFAGNIGSIARVMKNMGFSQLVLVSPKANHLDDEAKNSPAKGKQSFTIHLSVIQSSNLLLAVPM